MTALEALLSLDTRWVLVALLLVLDAWAIGLILRSEAPWREALLWSAIIVLCPIVGCLFWYVLGPKPDLRADRP